MKNKVLIIYPYSNQEKLVLHLVENLRENGISADAINSFNLKFVITPQENLTLYQKIISFLWTLKIPKLKGLLSKLISREKELLKIAENYDLIDFHVLSKNYDSLIKELSNRKYIKVTYWGSDFYRASSERREEQRKLLRLAERIQIATEIMKNDLLNYFQEFHDKINIANFGIYQFDTISNLLEEQNSPKFKTLEYDNKLMVVCGYNASEAQQHLTIIKAISNIEQALKEKILLVFPMTYGGNADYISLVQKELGGLGIPYLFLTEHLNDVDIAKLRIETDIAINIQKTDAFSASLQEHLFAENLLLVGDWLPYQILNENNIYYKSTKVDSLTENISDCIINYEEYKSKTLGNRGKMFEISSWKIAGKKIAHIYKAIFE